MRNTARPAKEGQDRLLFFPVRHHSPAAARAVRALAGELQPAAILIEGPSDFNDRIAELYLPHRLPIAIYTYLRLEDGARRGAFYPFSVYSPEWQALQVAAELGVPARFIDLPWAEMAAAETPSHRYADGELRASDYIDALCHRLGVEGFDALWDTLVEIDPHLTPAQYLERCLPFCAHARELDRHVPEVDLRREDFMADRIREALAEFPGPVLVVTGGFHTSALRERIENENEHEDENDSGLGDLTPGPFPTREGVTSFGTGPNVPPPAADSGSPSLVGKGPGVRSPDLDRGIALTPYSYERLDSLVGYEAGMPSPGFYHQVWEDREAGAAETHRRLLARVVRELRARGQAFSTADLIAVEATAQGLATLRGHAAVWRTDLVDGILGALVKDELEQGVPHPFLEAVQAVFRGGERGRLADGVALPPLVHDLRRQLAEHGLEPEQRERAVDLELTEPEDLARSRVLHQLATLRIAGFQRAAGTDLATREDLSRLWERWSIRWSPDYEATSIEAAIYGPTLAEAAAARLQEQAGEIERDAEAAALLLLQAGLMGLLGLAPEFRAELLRLVRGEGSFFGITGALGHLLYVFRYDEALGTAGAAGLGELLAEAWDRGLWLLEGLGDAEGQDRALLRGVAALLRTFESCGPALELGRAGLVDVLRRVSDDPHRPPLLRGAAVGALWGLGEAAPEAVLAGMRYAADPSHLGDFLAGLFSLAREAVQRHPELVVSLDDLLLAYSDEQFLEALPALRLAFSYFTPREKHYLARTLLEARGMAGTAPLPALEVTPEVAARALALEARVFAAVDRYGLRVIAPLSDEVQ